MPFLKPRSASFVPRRLSLRENRVGRVHILLAQFELPAPDRGIGNVAYAITAVVETVRNGQVDKLHFLVLKSIAMVFLSQQVEYCQQNYEKCLCDRAST